MMRFTENENSKVSFKYCLIYGGTSFAFINNSKKINDEKTFKKDVGRLSDVIIGQPIFNDLKSS